MPKRKPNKPGRPQKDFTTSDSGTLYFWRPQVIPYGVFSQWYKSCMRIPTASLAFLVDNSPATTSPAPILANYGPTLTCSSAEQFFMFAKALFFGDAHMAKRIMSTQEPKDQKKYGRAVEGFDEAEWTNVKSKAARLGNWYKFREEGELREILLGTGNRELVEASPYDPVWGIGFREADAEAAREAWGENRLGKALVEVRTRLKEVLRDVREGKTVEWEWDGGEDEDEDYELVEAQDQSQMGGCPTG